MEVVIIEDEPQAALNLQAIIEDLRPEFTVKAILDSIESSIEWFTENPPPDLIFSDIQLGDGLSFEVFKEIKLTCPIIFCTAFDQYAIEAFKNNGVDYLLKPVAKRDLVKSIEKIEAFQKRLSLPVSSNLLQKIFKDMEANAKQYKSTFLVSFREKLIPVQASEIKLLRIVNDATQIITSDFKKYQMNQSLDNLEKQIDPKRFYRANRQNILAFDAIKDVENDLERKLKVNLTIPDVEPVIISKAKASEFLKWISSR